MYGLLSFILADRRSFIFAIDVVVIINTERLQYNAPRTLKLRPYVEMSLLLLWPHNRADSYILQLRFLLVSCSTCPHNMMNFRPLTGEIGWRVWGAPANFKQFRVLASLLHRRRPTEVNQTLHDV